MRFLFFTIVISVLFLLVGYTTWRGMQSLAIFGNYKYIFTALVGVGFLTLINSFVLGDFMSVAVAKPMSFIAYSYFIFTAYLFVAFLLIDLILVADTIFHIIPNLQLFRAISFGLVFTGILTAMVIGNYRFNHPEIVHLKIDANKPKQEKSIKIVAVSDLHLGFSNDKSYAQKYVKLINEQQPDLVLIAGDLIDRTIKPLLKQQVQEDLKSIESKYGVYAVLGNHEYFGEGVEQVRNFFQSCNIHLLKDEHALINNDFYVVGRDDKSNRQRKYLDTLISGFDADKPIILLDHQPFLLVQAAALEIDFQFSGHTHNGQFFPVNLMVDKMYEKAYGYVKRDLTHVYVSSGLGIWGPQYRIGTQSELVVIEFRY